MVYAHDLKSCLERDVGSMPTPGTKNMHNYFKQYMRAVSNPLPEMKDYFDRENNYLKKIANARSVVLDVGCGNGRTMKFLAPYVEKVVGIDYDPKMVEEAQKNLAGVPNIGLIQKDFFDEKFIQNFDLTFASYSLLGSAEMELKNQKLLLQKMAKITKSGGHVIASAWNVEEINFARNYYPYIGVNVLKIENHNVVTDQGIFRRFSRQDLEKLAEGIGSKFNIIKLTNLFYLLDILI